MSTDNQDPSAAPLPALDPGHPANAGVLTGAPAKPKRTRTAKTKTADDAAQEKPKRTTTRKKAAPAKTLDAPGQGGPTADAPAFPPITPDAVAFLANPNAPAADMFKLSPEGKAFVQYHLNYMAQQEENSRLTEAYLLASARRGAPGTQPFIDAVPPSVLARRSQAAQPIQGAPVASYAPKPGAVAAYTPATVELRTLEIARAEPTNPTKATPDEQTRASIPIATAHMLASLPIDDLTPQETVDLVRDDISALSGIKHEATRQHALAAIAQSLGAQSRYRIELERQAPELAKTLARDAGQQVENSIEPTAPIRRKDLPDQVPQQGAPAASTEDRAAADPLPRPGFGRRLLQAIGTTAVKVGTRLAEQGKEGPAPTATPVSLDKRGIATAIPATPATAAPVMPEAVARRFMKVEQDYYFPDKTHAFADRGGKLATRGHHPEVVRALVEVARARGWDSITVKGTDEFRRGAWLEAAQSGLKVAGYQPTALDLAELAQRPASNSVEPGTVQAKAAAPAQPTPMEQQAAKMAARITPVRPTVAVQAGPQGVAGKGTPAPDPALADKARTFDKEKPAFAVKKYPELAGAYGMVEAAKAFALEKLPESAREEFVGMARRHVMQKIITGQQVNGPKIYVAQAKAKEGAEQGRDADLGKPPRAKEPAKER